MSTDTPTEKTEFLSFRVHGQDYAVNVNFVREIRSWTKPTPLPHAPAFVQGVINLRGSVLSILNLGVRLGLDPVDPAQSDRSVVIFVEIGDETIGLKVDAVSDILAFTHEQLSPPPSTSAQEHRALIKSLAILDDSIIRILDLERLLEDDTLEAA